ncbi:four helix bundle protein [bacterium]|nr:four helix bundle protein [bacterium]
MNLESKENITQNKSYAFALKIVKLYKQLASVNKEFVLSKQILKSGTSIGANVAEANGAISGADFSSKISIAYKEALETKYWLSLLHDGEFVNKRQFEALYADCDELCRILFSILKTTRINKSKQ